MELGSVADWLGAVGSLGAVGAALVIANLERQRAERAERSQRAAEIRARAGERAIVAQFREICDTLRTQLHFANKIASVPTLPAREQEVERQLMKAREQVAKLREVPCASTEVRLLLLAGEAAMAGKPNLARDQAHLDLQLSIIDGRIGFVQHQAEALLL